MRVIAGTCRGMKLIAPPGNATRPTSDRVKESLFNIILSKKGCGGKCVLDICAGTGSLGIEALSRGAAFCSFVEQDRKVIEILNKNLSATHLDDRSELVQQEAAKALTVLAGRGRKYDLVFFDPPYESRLYDTVPELLNSLELLNFDALLVAECSRRKSLPEAFGALIKNDRRVYGDTSLEFFNLEEI